MLPSSIFDLHASWMHRYPGQLSNNIWFKASWLVLPKLVCWHIWLERNCRIFQGKTQNAQVVTVKIKSILKEFMYEHVGSISDENLSSHELEWGDMLGVQFSQTDLKEKKKKVWQIIMSEENFCNRNKDVACFSLFFDAIANGNPGKQGQEE